MTTTLRLLGRLPPPRRSPLPRIPPFWVSRPCHVLSPQTRTLRLTLTLTLTISLPPFHSDIHLPDILPSSLIFPDLLLLLSQWDQGSVELRLSRSPSEIGATGLTWVRASLTIPRPKAEEGFNSKPPHPASFFSIPWSISLAYFPLPLLILSPPPSPPLPPW